MGRKRLFVIHSERCIICGKDKSEELIIKLPYCHEHSRSVKKIVNEVYGKNPVRA